MSGRWTPLSLIALLVAVGLAGCADEPTEPVEDTVVDEDLVTDELGRDLRTDLLATDSLPAPEWRIGDWFGHHVFFGADDTQGTHINTIVVGEAGSDWVLAPDDPEVAKFEAAWDFPMVGAIAKSDLSTTAFTADWNIYKFPMTDGDAWTMEVDPLFNGRRTLSLTATYNDAIKTPYGIRPGFDIVGLNDNGDVELQTDYVPEIGWYNELRLYDVSTEDPDDFVIHIISMGRGHDWTGEYFVSDARQVVNYNGYITPLDAANSSPPQQETFTMNTDNGQLYGVVFTLAAAGTSRVDFMDPANGLHTYEVTHTGDPTTESEVLFEFVDQPAQAGDWQFTWVGAGVVAVGFAWLWEITTETLQL